MSNDLKVNEVKTVFKASGAAEATQIAVKDYTEKAFGILNTLDISEEKKQLLRLFGEQLMNRNT